MVLFNSINDLISSNSNPCYFEYAGSPNDISFQINIFNAPTLVGTNVSVLNPTTYAVEGDVTSLFTISASGSILTFTLNDFSEFMCTCKKFIIRVSCNDPAFIYYLGIYKIDGCCPSEYTVNIGGTITPSDKGDDVPDTTFEYTMQCRGSNLKLITWNDCQDAFTGEYFKDGFRKITNLEGRIIQKPRELKKTMSRNCKVLSVESAAMYEVEVWDYLPAWKMEEVALQLQHENIIINNERYYFTEGTPATHLEAICQPTYTMRFTVQKCNTRQFFACGDVCSPSGVKSFFYKTPDIGDMVYSEDRVYIGNGSGAVLNGLNGSYGAVSSEVAMEGYIAFETTGSAPIFYYNGTMPNNTQYPYTNPSDALPDVPLCAAPVLGTIVVTNPTCASPVLGTTTITLDGNVVSMNINVKKFAGNGLNAQTFAPIGGRELLTIELNGQSYTSDFWVQVVDTVTWKDGGQVFEGSVVLTWNNDPYYSTDIYSANAYVGLGANSQYFADILGRELITVEMGGQSYTSDFWVHAGGVVTWNDSGWVFAGTIVLTWK